MSIAFGNSIQSRSLTKYVILTLLFFISITSLSAKVILQKMNTFQNVPESVLLNTDRSIYISGETIWFSVYIFDSESNKLSDVSKIANIELINEKGAVVVQLKSEIIIGRGAGTINLPKEITSGRYTIRSYTQQMKYYGEDQFFRKSIKIINPKNQIKKDAKDAKTQLTPKASIQAADIELIVKAANTIISQGDLINLDIQALDKNKSTLPIDISIAVVVHNAHDHILKDESKFPIAQSNSCSSLKIEANSMIISGKVSNEASQVGVKNALTYLSIPNEAPLLYSNRTNEDGQFQFRLPLIYGLQPVILQVAPEDDNGIIIEIDNEFHEITPLQSVPLSIPPNLVKTIERLMTNASISQNFDAFSTPTEYYTESKFPDLPFFGTPDVSYKLDDYNRFPLPEFFVEVTPEVRVDGKKEAIKLRVLNTFKFKEGLEPALMVVDGVPIFDASTFLKINNQLVESAEIFTTPFWLNPLVFDGIIHLSTFEGDARCFDLPKSGIRRTFLGIQPKRDFEITPTKTVTEQHIPNFKNTLFWSPMTSSTEEKTISIEFPSSDALGIYDINIIAITESGKIIQSTSTIEVVKNSK